MSFGIARVTAALGAAALVACGGRAPAAAPRPATVAPAARCVLLAPPAQAPDTVTIASTDLAADPLLLDQLYAPLIQRDCAGMLSPAAAVGWSADATGRVWTITLREDARWWDGTAVAAAQVIAGWGNVRPLGIEHAVAVDDHRIALTFAAPHPAVPPVLLDPLLAVRRPEAGRMWAEGSGPYRPDTMVDGPGVRAVPVGRGPVLTFRAWPNDDARDALDAGADVLLTNDPSAIAYAATLPWAASVPLPWSRTYVLVGASAPPIDDALRAELARGAVRVEARAAAPPEWWRERGCTSETTASAPTAIARLAYPRGDRPARDLAERLVALGVAGRQVRAVALEEEELAAAWRTARDMAYVLALPRHPGPGCGTLPRWPVGAAVVPLIDTRARAIVRRGTVGLSADGDGRLRLALP